MKKLSTYAPALREADNSILSELQKDWKEYFIAKLNKFGVKSPAELDEEKKKEFFNELKKDWERGKSATETGKKDIEKYGTKESEDTPIESVQPENLVESFVNLDCTDPGGDDLIKFMKKHNIKMTIVNSAAYPECKFVGKKDDLKKLITDFWDDEDLFDYIKESKEIQIDESRSIDNIRAEWDKTIKEMKEMVTTWKKADDDTKAGIMTKLKELTSKKGALEKEITAAIVDLDKNLELEENPIESVQPENLVESFVNLDCIDPEDDDLIKFMQKHNIKMTIVNIGSHRSYHSSIYSECKFVGKKDDLKKLITDFWDDEDLFDFIKETDALDVVDEALTVNALGIDNGVFYVDINGNKYGYNALGGISIDDIAQKFTKMLKFSAGKALSWLKKNGNLVSGGKVKESMIKEAHIKSESDFKEYAETVLKKAHGDKYDETIAKKTVDGIIKKANGNWGAAIGMLTSGLGESATADLVKENITEPKLFEREDLFISNEMFKNENDLKSYLFKNTGPALEKLLKDHGINYGPFISQEGRGNRVEFDSEPLSGKEIGIMQYGIKSLWIKSFGGGNWTVQKAIGEDENFMFKPVIGFNLHFLYQFSGNGITDTSGLNSCHLYLPGESSSDIWYDIVGDQFLTTKMAEKRKKDLWG